MTVNQFDNGYWYAVDLKKFAHTIGVRSANELRKDELEKILRRFLREGRIESAPRRAPSKQGIKDVDRGLKPDLRVVTYTNDKATKGFLEREAAKMSPGHKRRSGARYRLNRWREEQIAKGHRITYRDLVAEYVRLCRGEVKFERVPHVRYINFLSDFLAHEKGATHARAIRAWKQVKQLDAPKVYRSWAKWSARRP